MATHEITTRTVPAQPSTRLHKGDAILSLMEMVERGIPTVQDSNVRPSSERYFAIVIKADDTLGGVLFASTNLGNYLRERESELLPPGCRITRSIEITKRMATEAWV